MLSRIHSIVLLLALLIGAAGMNYVQAATYSGNCGTSATWSLNTSTGVLTISGSGAMTDWSTATDVPWNTYSTYVKSATISSGITSIGRYSFSKCSNLTTATIPSSVTRIGADAFSYCSSLKSITLPSNLTTVYNGAFMGCTSLTTVTIPTKLTTLPNNMFNGCTSLKSVTLHNQLTEIGQYCFKNCSSLTSITIPSSVTKVDYYAFQSCTGLKNITFPNKVTTISQGVCMGCTALTSVTIQGSVTNINQYALYGCSSLTTFTIPTTVKQIGNCAFQGCSSLKSIAVPSGVTSIAISVFENCTSLASVTLPTTITSISYKAFKGCSSLTTLTIPANVTSIDYSVFENCTKLKSITIPNKVTAIKNNTFYNCTSLTSVTIPSSVTTISYSVFYNCTSLASISLPSSITSIGSSAFQGCAKLTSITIPSKVTKLETYTFSGCTSLTSFTIPSTITSLGTQVLGNCTSLKDITVSWTTSAAIPNWNNLTTNSGVKLHIPCGTGTIYRAKDGWKNYTIVGSTQYKLTVSASNSAYGSVKIGSGTASGSVSQNTYCEQEVQLTAVPKAGYHFTKWSGGSTATTNPLTVTMPGANTTYTANFAITNYTITAKTNNSGLGTVSGGGTYQEGKTATLTATPANCTSAFVQWNDGNTDNPRSFTVTESKTYTAQFASLTGNCGANGNNLTWSFNRCTGVLTISGSGAMKDFTASTTGYDGDGTNAPWNDYRSSITKVVLPYGLTNIGVYAFYYCTHLTDIDIPASVTSIGDKAFAGCTSLKQVCIPEGVTTIGSYLFFCMTSNTSSLQRLYLPSTLTSMGTHVVYKCGNLRDFTIPASISGWSGNMRYSRGPKENVYVSWTENIPTCPLSNEIVPNPRATLHVPYGKTSQYNTKQWYKSFIIVEDVDERAIDLGLSIRWASCNIGATSPEENGEYYMWADTLGGWSSYVMANYPYYKNNQYTRYNATDHRTRLIPFDDVAYIRWGETWRMPTKDEWHELFTQCIWEKEKLNDVWVYKVTGPNGNYIYIPLPGYIEGTFHSPEADGYYWTSELYSTGSPISTFISSGGTRNSGPANPSYGRSVRAVYRREWPSFTLTITDTPEGTPYTKSVNAGSSYTLTAQEGNCRAFVRWSDGNTSNPRTVTVTADATYTAEYEDAPLASGTCGYPGNENNVTWSLSCDSVLTISGTGAMAHYNSNTMPWYAYRKAIKSVVIGGGVTNIGQNAFYACSSLTSVTLPSDFTSISDYAFYGCGSLTSITIPSSTNHLGWDAFMNTGLTDVFVYWTTSSAIPYWNDLANTSTITLHVPCGTQSVYKSKNGWKDCNIVEEIASGTCGAQGDNLTWSLSCDGVLTISGTGAMKRWEFSVANYPPWYDYSSSITSVVITDGVTNIGGAAFQNLTNLTSISIPNSVTTIQDASFYGCSNLTSINLPSGLTSIGDGECCCFAYSGLTSITIPVTVRSIGQWSFCDISSLTDIYVSWTENIPTWTNMTNKSGITLHVPCGTKDLYKAENGWKGYTVSDGSVRGTCGVDGDNLTWTLCEGILTISGTGEMANWSITTTPWKNYKTDITSVSIEDGVTSIGSCAFYGCSNLTSVTIGTSVTTIKESVFAGCTSLTSITFPNSVTSIGQGVCNGCIKLTSVVLPDGLKNISSYAFKDCFSLTSITIPDGVEFIRESAFNYCKALQSVTIPSSVIYIYAEAFRYCSALKNIYVSWTENIPYWPPDMTSNSDITLHVPCAAIDLYQDAYGWKDYTIEGEGGPYTVTVQAEDPTMGDVSIIVN